jgi:hypothetical protein
MGLGGWIIGLLDYWIIGLLVGWIYWMVGWAGAGRFGVEDLGAIHGGEKIVFCRFIFNYFLESG